MVDANEGAIRTVIVEIKYVSSNNVATENYKLEISLDCTPEEFEKTIHQGSRNLVGSEDLRILHWRYFALTLSSWGILERHHLLHLCKIRWKCFRCIGIRDLWHWEWDLW